MKKANNREELAKMLSAPMKEALNILKENNMHGVVNIYTNPDADYIFFFCLGNENFSFLAYPTSEEHTQTGTEKVKEALCDIRNAYKEQTKEGEE